MPTIEQLDQILDEIPFEDLINLRDVMEKKLKITELGKDVLWVQRNFKRDGLIDVIGDEHHNVVWLTTHGLMFRERGGYGYELEKSKTELKLLKRQARYARPAFWIAVGTGVLFILQTIFFVWRTK